MRYGPVNVMDPLARKIGNALTHELRWPSMCSRAEQDLEVLAGDANEILATIVQ